MPLNHHLKPSPFYGFLHRRRAKVQGQSARVLTGIVPFPSDSASDSCGAAGVLARPRRQYVGRGSARCDRISPGIRSRPAGGAGLNVPDIIFEKWSRGATAFIEALKRQRHLCDALRCGGRRPLDPVPWPSTIRSSLGHGPRVGSGRA